MPTHAILAPRLFDGTRMLDDSAVLCDGGQIVAVLARQDLPSGVPTQTAPGLLVPGFVDAQVNGGGGVMLNDAPSVATIDRIAMAHHAFGTTALVPTLITDSPAITGAAIAAAVEAANRPGSAVAGLHLEGPHLAPARKGAHRADLIRPMTDADLHMLLAAAARLPVLMVTLAPEAASPVQVKALVQAGVVVSLGHSDCDAATAAAYAEAGARGVTHLFNAMSGLGHRAPGLVGAALDDGRLWAGFIADGHHADPMALRIALRAKRGPGCLFLVTDAMALVGHAGDSFQLNGREIRRHPGGGGVCSRLTLADGTLAGSDLDMASAVRLAHRMLDLDLTEALAMATSIPADFLRLPDRGRLAAGCRADMVALDADLRVARVWQNGV